MGENLQDHCLTPISFKVADLQVSGDIACESEVIQCFLQLYQETRGSPLAGAPISMTYLPLVGHDGKVSKYRIKELLNNHPDNLPKQHVLLREILLKRNSFPASDKHGF